MQQDRHATDGRSSRQKLGMSKMKDRQTKPPAIKETRLEETLRLRKELKSARKSAMRQRPVWDQDQKYKERRAVQIIER